MAEQSTDTLLKFTDKLMCQACNGMFKSLKRFQCLHSVCDSCFTNSRGASRRHSIIACPCCKQEHELESGNVDDLPNTPYIGILYDVASMVNSKIALMLCAFCKTEPATLLNSTNYCLDCKIFLCEKCIFRHDADHSKADHLRVPVSSENNNDVEDVLKPCTKCPKKNHEKEELNLFCTDCNVPVCNLCSWTDHRDHKYEVLKTVADEQESQITTLIDEQLKEAHRKMDEVSQIEKECDEITRQAADVKAHVTDFYKNISECLEAKKKKLIVETERLESSSRSSLKRQKKMVQNQGEVIRFGMETAASLLKYSTSVEIINLKKSLDMIVAEVKEEERNHFDPDRKPLQMNFAQAGEILETLNKKGIGSLQTTSETDAGQCSVQGSGICEAFVGLEANFKLTTRSAKGDYYYNKTDRITLEVNDKDGHERATGVRIHYIKDGTYEIRYFAKKAEELHASVQVNGEHVSDSPFPVHVKTRGFKPEVMLWPSYGPDVEEAWGLAVSNDDEIALTNSSKKIVQLCKSDMVTVLTFSKPGNRDKEFDSPTGVVFDKNGDILVADMTNSVVHMFSPKLESREYEYKGIKFGERGELEHQLLSPHGLSIDKDDNIIVADTDNKLIKIFTPEGKFMRKIGQGYNEEGSFKFPVHCVQCDKFFIVSDTFAHDIKVFDPEGSFLYKYGKQGNGIGEFNMPRCLAVDKVGQLLVCDYGNNRVQIFEPSESSLRHVGTIGTKGCNAGEFEQPFSAGVLSDGQIVVIDNGNKRMQRFK